MNDVYLKFLQIMESLDPFMKKNLSPTAISLLNKIATSDYQQQPLTVSEAMNFRGLGSPANLHHKLDELRLADMILISTVGTDRRTKYIFLTQTAKDFFQIHSDAMLQACESK